jgi:cytochrome c biogenesis protein CcmG/thiol:disulfide interchange protein DsbE
MTARRMRLLGWTLAAAATLAVLIVFGLAFDRSASVGRPAPALPREQLAGPPVTLAGLESSAQGRSVLVVFWASWCEPCVREAPAVERFSQSPAGHGRVVGVDWSDGLSSAREFIRRFGWTFPNVRDGEGIVGNAYELIGLPTTFVLDSSGRIRSTLHGPQTERTLDRALAGVS